MTKESSVYTTLSWVGVRLPAADAHIDRGRLRTAVSLYAQMTYRIGRVEELMEDVGSGDAVAAFKSTRKSVEHLGRKLDRALSVEYPE